MLACINPAYSSTNHTINTLRYSDRLKEKTKNGGGSVAYLNHPHPVNTKENLNTSNITDNIKEINNLSKLNSQGSMVKYNQIPHHQGKRNIKSARVGKVNNEEAKEEMIVKGKKDNRIAITEHYFDEYEVNTKFNLIV